MIVWRDLINHRISSDFSPSAYFKYVPVAIDSLKPHILKQQPTEPSPVSILPRLGMIYEELIKNTDSGLFLESQ